MVRHRGTSVVLVILAWGAALAPRAQGALYVPTGPYPTIQAAIADATEPNVVIVAPGTYYENIDFLGKAITVRSTDPNDPNTVAVTVIDGALADPNNSVVTFGSGEGNDSVLEGFTITGGTGTWLKIRWWRPTEEESVQFWNLCGGAVLCHNGSSPTIRANVIRDNLAGEGAGIYAYNHSHPAILDNRITDNTAVREHGFDPPDDQYELHEHGDGGAIVCFQYSQPTIAGNEIDTNQADFYGGGLHLRQGSDATLTGNWIHHNQSALGAGVHITYASDPILTENVVENNLASNLGGGGIYVYYLSNPIIERNVIRQNTSGHGAGLAIFYNSTGTIRDNLIQNNQGGSGITCVDSSPLIDHNTIVHTAIPDGRQDLGGIELRGNCDPLITNNIIAFTQNGHGISATATDNPVIRYNDFWQNYVGAVCDELAPSCFQQGNTAVDPDLLDDTEGLVRLNYSSPCINTGDPNFTVGPGQLDFDGQARVVQDRTDMGADEALPVWNLTSAQYFEQIQAGIEAASDGDVLLVLPGRYAETLTLPGRAILLRSREPNDWNTVAGTIIDAQAAAQPGLTFAGTEDHRCTVAGFTITGALVSGSGGGVNGQGTGATLHRCWITANQAGYGAGLYDFDGTVQQCRITDNTAAQSGAGAYDCDGTIINSWFQRNQATLQGGGLAQGQALLAGCLIADNLAQAGGGVWEWTGAVVNCTVAGNETASGSAALAQCTGSITNTIVWANLPADEDALLNCTEPTYSCVQGHTGGLGNIAADPCFVDSVAGNYHLRLDSPCTDVGHDASVPPALTTDLDAEPRLFALAPAGAALIDMGADEVVTSTADFNGDGLVGLFELATLADEWLMTGPALTADLYGDQRVDLLDFALLADAWLWQATWHEAP